MLDKFNYVAGIVPVLSSYIETVSCQEATNAVHYLPHIPLCLPVQIDADGAHPSTDKAASQVKTALAELSCWLVVDTAREAKDRQKLLRNLRVCNFRSMHSQGSYLLLFIYRCLSN